jgi:hypothetical protein
MGLLHGRVAIVTGGAGNLGAHISRLFAAQGAGVVVNDVNVGSGARVVGEIEAAGGWAVFDSTDVSTPSGRALVQRAVDEFGTVDALALLAGRIPLTPLADVSEDERDGVISSHLKGHYHPHPGGRTRHEGEALRPHRRVRVCTGHHRRLPPDAVLRGQGRNHRPDARHHHRARPLRHLREHRVPGRG